MTIHGALEKISRDEAKEYINEYFGSEDFTGASFSTLGGESTPPNQITATDLLAVQTLSVHIPAKPTIAILGPLAAEISDLLAEIPEDRDLADLSLEEHQKHLGPDSAATALWVLLRRTPGQRWGIGPTKASKILARKRPLLIPIQDSVVDAAVDLDRKGSWKQWWSELTVDSVLVDRATAAREDSGHTELSTLRALDIILWQHHRP